MVFILESHHMTAASVRNFMCPRCLIGNRWLCCRQTVVRLMLFDLRPWLNMKTFVRESIREVYLQRFLQIEHRKFKFYCVIQNQSSKNRKFTDSIQNSVLKCINLCDNTNWKFTTQVLNRSHKLFIWKASKLALQFSFLISFRRSKHKFKKRSKF